MTGNCQFQNVFLNVIIDWVSIFSRLWYSIRKAQEEAQEEWPWASIRTYLQQLSSLANLLWQVLRFAAHLKSFGIWSNYSRAKNEEGVSMGVSLLFKIWTWRSCCISRSISAPQWILLGRTLADQHDCVDFQPLFLPSLCLPSLLKCSRNITKCKKLQFEEAIKTEDS